MGFVTLSILTTYMEHVPASSYKARVFPCYIVFCFYVLILIPVDQLLTVGRSIFFFFFFLVFWFLFLHHAAESEYLPHPIRSNALPRLRPVSSTQMSAIAGLLKKKRRPRLYLSMKHPLTGNIFLGYILHTTQSRVLFTLAESAPPSIYAPGRHLLLLQISLWFWTRSPRGGIDF